ncbi:oligopeptide ABC transporter substrate-binding protein [Fundicoccus culcitae]|uniref:Oligopeptide ABC transporter substrate-binding protein n=1 Tax=Fundicoccus culcitae TaxID=2969821 RepID=A0ABY5P3Q1_9LACT|nr:oligopeptide ABC transporter substrate-binding protein [Fundicoccus culcitae]UUX33371.1 oligopeptide ABC transporter substrate-binding protein [Fundicoccus culcitae]
MLKSKWLKLSLVVSMLGSTFSARVFAQEETAVSFESSVVNEGEAIEGGTLRYAIVGDAFAGVFNGMYYTMGVDGTIISFFNPGLYGYDENFTIDNSGFADIEFDPDNAQVTITIPEGTFWDDGEPLDIDDVIAPYYIVGHPEYDGVRYGVAFTNVVGMEEYKNGDTDVISGLERIDDYTLRVTYIDFTGSILQAGGGVSDYVEPEHILSDIPIAEIIDSDQVRQSPVGFGPYTLTSIVPGEAVTFEANENYYKGKPLIDEIVVEVVSPSQIVAELKAGNYDIASLPSDQFETYKDATNFAILGVEANSYNYIGFKMGVWDEAAGEVNFDPDRVVSNQAFRQAMAYAIDNDSVGSRFYQGLRFNANSHVTPNFGTLHNPDQEGYHYDPEKAKALLAEAGFVDNDGDGFVEDLNGEPFVLGFAAPTSGEVAEVIAQYYIQAWHEVGINVELVDGNLMETNAFYERVEQDDPAIDVFQGAWTIGGDPNQYGFFGRDQFWNDSRFADEELDALHARLNSSETFDEASRIDIYYEWQAYLIDQIPLLPTLFNYSLTAVNNRVSAYDVTTGSDLDWTEIYLLADEPIAE